MQSRASPPLHTLDACPRLLPGPLREEWVEADMARELRATSGGSEPSLVPLKSLSLDGITLDLSVLAARAPT